MARDHSFVPACDDNHREMSRPLATGMTPLVHMRRVRSTLMTTFLLDAVRNLASPVLGARRSRVALRHRDTGVLFGSDDYVAFADEHDAARFVADHACEPEAWETVPLAS
jgi:hypothetical protein